MEKIKLDFDKIAILVTRSVNIGIFKLISDQQTLVQIKKMSASNPNQDKYFMSYIVFYSMGIISLVPTNFFTTSTDYWMYKFRNSSSNASYNDKDKTTLQAQFVADFSIVANVFFVVFVFLTARYSRIVKSYKLVIGTLCFTTCIFAVTAILSQVNSDSWQTTFFVVTMIEGALLTASSCIFMTTAFKIVAKFPYSYTTALLSGQSMCGIFSALIQIISISIGASPETAGLLFFLLGMLFVIASLAIFVVMLKKSPHFRYYVHLNIEKEHEKPNIQKKDLKEIFFRTKYYYVAIFLVALASCVQPGLTSLYAASNKYFIPGVTFLSYSIFDYAGKEAARKFQKPSNPFIVLALTTLRLALIPLLMLCSIYPRNHNLIVAFPEDWTYVIFLLILGFTNGYFINLCMVLVSASLDADLQKLGTFITLLVLTASLGLTSFICAGLVSAL